LAIGNIEEYFGMGDKISQFWKKERKERDMECSLRAPTSQNIKKRRKSQFF
jgi:hypothetical protein